MLLSLQYCHLEVNTVFYFIPKPSVNTKGCLSKFLTDVSKWGVHAEFGVKLKLLSFLVSHPHPVANNHRPTDI